MAFRFGGDVVKMTLTGFVIYFLFFMSSCKTSELAVNEDQNPLYYVDTLVYYKSLKMAHLLDTEPDHIMERKMYKFVDEWLGVPFGVSGGVGLDNGKLVQLLYKSVYDVTIPFNYEQLVYDNRLGLYTGKEFWAEGDLLFFEYSAGKKSADQPKVSEKVIGVYLMNNRFLVNCKKTGRVSIERIDDKFWARHFRFAGRCK